MFFLTGYNAETDDDPDKVIDDIRERTGWDVVVSNSVQPIAQPTATELALLRGFDPRSVFLKNRNRTPEEPQVGQNSPLHAERAIGGQ